MKRFLALLLTLVMLVSVCGLQAFAADGDTPADTGDELVVYTRSGATRTFHVGDTFRLLVPAGIWLATTITGHVLYDSQCLSVNADGCKFPNMTSPSTKTTRATLSSTIRSRHRRAASLPPRRRTPWRTFRSPSRAAVRRT